MRNKSCDMFTQLSILLLRIHYVSSPSCHTFLLGILGTVYDMPSTSQSSIGTIPNTNYYVIPSQISNLNNNNTIALLPQIPTNHN